MTSNALPRGTGDVRLSLLTFSLGTQLYALPIDDVLEVAAMVELSPLPGARREVLGLANRHGSVLMMLDLRPILKHRKSAVNASTLFIVAAQGPRMVGLVVDEVHQVEHIRLENLVRASSRENYIRGVIPYQDRLIQVISLPALLQYFVPEEWTNEEHHS